MSAMTIRAIAEAHNTFNGMSLSIAKPTGLQAGDTMLAVIGTNIPSATITAPDGWTPVTSSSSLGSVRSWAFFRVAGAGEPASYLFLSDTSGALVGEIAAYEGTASVHVSASNYTAGSWEASHTLPSLTTSEAATTLAYLAITYEPPMGAPNHTVDAQSSGTLQDTHTGWWVSSAVGDKEAALADTYSGVTMSAPYPACYACVAVSLLPGTTAVTVSVSPPTANVVKTNTKQFAATVEGYVADDTVTWSVEGGGAGGSIDAAGLYTAPNATGTDTVTATSDEDPTKHAHATVTVLDSGTIVPVRLVFRRRGV